MSDTALTDAIYAADYDMFIWGWGSDADPDFILSVLTCDQIMGWSDTFWCNEDYSRMYQEQKKQLDLDERAATIKEMQRIAYEDNPYVIFYYDNQFEAWRTDKFEGWTKTPTTADPGQVAFTFSNETYMNLRPLSSSDETGGGGGTSPLLYVGIGLVGSPSSPVIVVLSPAGERGGQGLSRARYVAGKLIGAVGTLFFVLVLNFFLFRILPGDPERTLTRLQRASPSTIDEVKKELGLDRPLPVQFFDYLGDTARGELGISYVFSRPVSEVIGTALWPTILLVGVATVAATVIGTLMGIWGAWRRGSAVDTSLLGFGLVTYAMPEFWLGMLLILVFAVALDWFPTSFMTTPGLTDASAGVQLVDTLEHLFLPALTLVLALLGEYALIMRSSVIEAMNEDYVTTARAKGMREALVLRKHVVPNALLPVVTLAALNLGFIVSGAITVETVFSWPGLGQLTFRAINGGPDYPLLQGLFLLFSVAVIFANLAADLLLGLLDPRIGRA